MKVNVTAGPEPSFNEPVLSFDENDSALVVWTQPSSSTVSPQFWFWSRRKPAGQDWANQLTIAVGAGTSGVSFNGAFARSATGSALVMWSELGSDRTYPCGSSMFSNANGWSSAIRVAENCASWSPVVAANAKGDFVLGYYDDSAVPARLLVAPYFSETLGPAHAVSSGVKPELDQSQLSLSLRDDRTIRAVYFAGVTDRALYVE